MNQVDAASLPARPGRARIWWLAIRPATLPASASGVLVGLGVAWRTGAAFRIDAALGCLVVALLLQAGANLANDLSDFGRGADTPDRLGPTRVAAAGFVSIRQLRIAIGLVFGAAALDGLWLATIGGPGFIVLGLAAIVAAVAYTGGPLAYGYHGLGEVFVFLFFGLAAVVGTAVLQSVRLDALYFGAAVPVGTLTTSILVVNNLRDAGTDEAAGKRTLAVRFGRGFARAEYLACLVVAWATLPLLAALTWRSTSVAGAAVLLPLASIPMAVPLWRSMSSAGDPRRLNLVLKGTARLTLVFACLLAAGLALGRP